MNCERESEQGEIFEEGGGYEGLLMIFMGAYPWKMNGGSFISRPPREFKKKISNLKGGLGYAIRCREDG
jgi:hypothetical protein